MPLLQLVAAVEPAKQKAPAGQGLHPSLLCSPVWLLNSPAGHGSAAAAPSAQYEPGGQASHAVLPASCWKVPATQFSQVPMPALGATVPGLQSMALALPTGQ